MASFFPAFLVENFFFCSKRMKPPQSIKQLKEIKGKISGLSNASWTFYLDVKVR